MNRLYTVTQRVPTRFGSLYIHVEHDETRKVHAVSFSSPGKFSETAMGDALDALGTAVTEVLDAIGGSA